MKVTFLGPVGATFSHDAYSKLASLFKVPESTDYFPATNNGDILKMIVDHGGYGAIAMETLAEGRVAEPVESFIDLLKHFDSASCPIRVIGAMKIRLHFCLMVKQDRTLNDIDKIIAHPKALGACKGRLLSLDAPTLATSSNGEAARLVAETDEHKNSAALGPKSAAEKYGLSIIHEAYEDREAKTTFFLIGPSEHPVSTSKENRCLIVFEIPHEPGALVKALLVFEQANLNLIQIHSMHVGNHTYHFASEIILNESEVSQWETIEGKFKKVVSKYICFGPFPVLS